MRHEGKVAIITGAAQGIGFGCAEQLYREGARVVLADINNDKVVESAKKLDPNGKKAIGLACDVASRRQVDAVVASRRNTYSLVSDCCSCRH